MSVLQFFSFLFSFFFSIHGYTFSAKPIPLSCWSAQGFPCFTCTECIDTGASGSAWAGDKTSPRGARKVYRKDHPGKYETHLLGEKCDRGMCHGPGLSGTCVLMAVPAWPPLSKWRIWKLGKCKLKPVLQLWIWLLCLVERSFVLPCVWQVKVEMWNTAWGIITAPSALCELGKGVFDLWEHSLALCLILTPPSTKKVQHFSEVGGVITHS